MALEGTPEFNRHHRTVTADLTDRGDIPVDRAIQVEGDYMRNGAALDPRADREFGIDKESLAMRAIEQYTGLVDVLGHDEAARELGLVMGEYVLHGELNQFEADLIGVVAILGNVATNVMNENERLRGM